MADFNLFSVPDYYGGLLGEEGVKKLQNQALGTGLINAALGFIAQPRNQRYGSALPYLGKALAAGYQSGQDVIAGGLRDYETKQKIEEMQRQKKAREAFDVASGNLYKTIPAQMETVTTPGGYAPAQTDIQAGQVAPNFGMARLPDVTTQQEISPARKELNPEALQQMLLSGDPRAASYLSGLKTLKEINASESQLAKIDQKDYTSESFAKYLKSGSRADLVPITKEGKSMSYTDAYKNIAITKFGTDNPSLLTKAERDEVDREAQKRSNEKPPQTVIMTPRQIFQDEQALRKEYSAIPEVKLFGEVQNSYDTIKNSLSKPSAAGDLAGATKFMKLLDPGSVVRESELGMAMAATGALDRATNYYEVLKSGKKLTPAQRQDFINVADTLYKAAEARKSSYDQQYGSIAEQNQLNPTNVVKGFKKQGGWSIKEKP